MAEVVDPHLYYPDGYPGSAYDLRDVVSWYAAPDATKVLVRFSSCLLSPVEFDKTSFEAAKTASLAAGG